MTQPTVDLIAPIFMGASAIRLSRAEPNVAPVPYLIERINIDYSETLPEGVRLPLELLVTPPSGSGFRRQIFRRFAPVALFIKPLEGGPHTVVLREVGHNYWRGSLVVQVDGASLGA